MCNVYDDRNDDAWGCRTNSDIVAQSPYTPTELKLPDVRPIGGSWTYIQSTYLISLFRHIPQKGFYKVLQYFLKKVLPVFLRCCHGGTNVSWMSMIWRCNAHNQSQWLFPQPTTWYISTTNHNDTFPQPHEPISTRYFYFIHEFSHILYANKVWI